MRPWRRDRARLERAHLIGALRNIRAMHEPDPLWSSAASHNTRPGCPLCNVAAPCTTYRTATRALADINEA